MLPRNAESLLAELAEDHDTLVTLEDHVVDAGFGSWLAESCLHLRDRTAIEIRGLSREIFGKVVRTLSKIQSAVGWFSVPRIVSNTTRRCLVSRVRSR